MIRNYVDAFGRPQRAVDGPNGTYLITQEGPNTPYQVWRSDNLHINGHHRNAVDALEHACWLAGVKI